MKRPNHIPAFTLAELTVAMTLSGLVVALAVTVISLAQRELFSFQNSHNAEWEIASVERQLAYDVEACHLIQKSGNGVHLVFSDSLKVDYQFDDKVVLRSYLGKTDTFHLPVSEIALSYVGEAQFMPKGPIDQIRFQGEMDGANYPFHFQKEYATRERMRFAQQGLSDEY